MSDTLTFGCRCGSVRGELDTRAPAPIRCICYCRDCQAQARHFGVEDVFMDAHAGIEIVQVASGNISVVKGLDQVEALRLTPRGVYRFYAGCCGTPLFSTAPAESWPVSGMPAAVMDADAATRERVFGPVEFVPFKSGMVGVAPKRKGVVRQMARLLGQMRAAKRMGRAGSPVWKDGEPVVDPRLITEEERARAYLT